MPLRWSRVQAHVYVNLATIHDADERHRVTIMLFALTVIIDTTQFLLFFFHVSNGLTQCLTLCVPPQKYAVLLLFFCREWLAKSLKGNVEA